MRLPLAIPMESRDGSTDQDGHLTNAVVEEYEGAFYVAPRPGLNELAPIDGAASGLVCFNSSLISLAGTSVQKCTNLSSADTWTVRTSPAVSAWRGVAFGNGKFVAVGYTGTLRTMVSSNGSDWTANTAAAANHWNGVCFGNGVFVAVANTGTNRVMVSSDGVSWTGYAASSARAWMDVTFGNGVFVAVSDDGYIMSSTNGTSWTDRTSPSLTSYTSVAYGNGRFVAVANADSGYPITTQAIGSTDGESWFEITTGFEGDETANQWSGVTYGNGIFVAVAIAGDRRIMYSFDGLFWNEAISPIMSSFVIDVAYGNGRFVAVAFDGGGGSSTRSMTSTNGIAWESKDLVSTDTHSSIAFGNDVFVSVAQSGTNNICSLGCVLTPVGTIAAGQYDFAQSSI